jgi:hypothetical protein
MKPKFIDYEGFDPERQEDVWVSIEYNGKVLQGFLHVRE